MRVLNRAAVAKALNHAQCVETLEETMVAVSDGRAIMPLRQYLDIPGTSGKFTMMPGYVDAPRTFGFKAVAKFPRSADSPFGSHVGAVMIFDADEGIPIALMDGAELTAIRTAAASALATRAIAREHSHVLAVLGTGTQALHHVHAIRAVRPIDEIRVWGRNAERAAELIRSLALPNGIEASVSTDVDSAVRGSDVVCATTSAKTPFLSAQQLSAGCHLNLVGAAIIDAAEAHADVVTDTRFFVDYRESAMAQAGELAAAIQSGVADESSIAGELGEVLSGKVGGRQTEEEVTTYKSLGVAAQDLAAAMAALNNAERQNIGVKIDWQ